MTSTVLGGVMMPHAPQFFTLPETEDKATVDRIRDLAGSIGERLDALDPDIWIIVANDHVNQFFLHCTPPFTVHMGKAAAGSFAGRRFRYEVPSGAALELIRHLQSEHFDPAFTSTAEIDYAFGIPLTFLGVRRPVLPIYVNSYVPPQPSIERCYAFGQAVARGLRHIGVSAVVVASGGMSHFPGTDRYAAPDYAFDQALVERLQAGNLRALLALDDARLDATGNVELRSWAIAGGMLGERPPDVCSIDPSWHHNYVTLAWFGAAAEGGERHYPAVDPERIALTEALHRLAHDPAERAAFLRDPAGCADARDLGPDERAAFVALDVGALVKLGVHPLVPFLARLQVDRDRSGR